MNGTIFNIQRFSLNDGPGIRTTVFMKGCNLRCKWCHNPEGLSKCITLQYIKNKCIKCKACSTVCKYNVHTFKDTHEIDFEKCKSCFECVKICPTNALVINGTNINSDALYNELIKDIEYFNEGGGVTFSGGEPLLQAEFIKDVAKKLKQNNIHISIDTTLNIEFEKIEELIKYVDLFLVDIKSYDKDLHYKNTGVYNELIKENIKKLNELKVPIWIRIPVIGGFNNNILEMKKILEFIDSLNNVERVTLIPFHSLGYEKYQSIGLNCYMNNYYEIDSEEMNIYKELFKNYIK